MKIFIYVLMVLALGLIVFNATLLDFDGLFQGDSQIAMIGILAAACVLVLLTILLISRRIAGKK
ncbi:hypothetical protein [Aureitalea marina]|uniref:Uncharacterized protein n=1 Tax=Aureitalea marina TaxID=930804 RepID=A0A2S7KRK0_9FLAO|nr:hypothetical protein [Aureitalea marina]PQB05227.1 hypothetical protein BST85_10290 [Aureitalea marina]